MLDCGLLDSDTERVPLLKFAFCSLYQVKLVGFYRRIKWLWIGTSVFEFLGAANNQVFQLVFPNNYSSVSVHIQTLFSPGELERCAILNFMVTTDSLRATIVS